MRTVSLPDEGWIAQVGPVDGIRLLAWGLDDEPPEPAPGLVVPPLGSPQRFARLREVPGLRVVQLVTAGYDHALPHLPDGVTLCNAPGVHDAATAELAVAVVLASLRGIPEFVRAQGEGRWVPLRMWPTLAERRVLVIGYGRIGRAVAERLAPFGARITAVAASPRPGDGTVERVHGVDGLPTLLPHHDVVILLTPLVEATRGLVDATFLAALPDGALVVNIARGPVVDTAALLAECASGRLRAAIDVHDEEPLPLDHPVWHTPGVLVTPHVGGAGDSFRPRMVALLRDQLGRYAADRPLLGVVAGPGMAR